MNIGEMIKQRRMELGLTLEEIGNIVGVSKSTVKKWEDGFISNMKRDKIALLAKALKMNPVSFITGETDLTHNINDLSPREQSIITAYRNNHDIQLAVDKILGIKSAKPTEKDKKIIAPIEIEDDNRQKLLSNYDKLNDDGQSKLLDYSADLVSGGRYVKNNQLFGAKEA